MSNAASLIDTADQLQRFASLSRNALIVLNQSSTTTFTNPTAQAWFNQLAVGEDVFDDDLLARKGMQFFNRKLIPTSLTQLLQHRDGDQIVRLVGHANAMRWVNFSVRTIANARFIEMSDVSTLIQELNDLQAQADSASNRDLLTGLYSRRYVMERLRQMYQHAKRYNSIFAIALLDIDHCKRINDTYGHDAGDGVIVRLAQQMLRTFRETDLCARFGGEEFMVLMPETDVDSALITLDRLRQQISELKWQHIKRPVTVSGGIVELQPNTSVEQLIFLADQRLHTAKTAGRNQVCGNLS